MKKVYILRHADKNQETGELTEIGRKRARELRKQLGSFAIVIGSDRPRILETAALLTGISPTIDARAGFIHRSLEQKEKLHQLAKIHPLSYAGALYEHAEFESMAQRVGENLIALTY